MNALTGNKTKDDILRILALGIRVEKKTIALVGNKSYVSRMYTQLKDADLVREIRKGEEKGDVVLTKQGVEYIKDKDNSLYCFYMEHSNGGKLGYSEEKIDRYHKTSQVLACMYLAEIDIGKENGELGHYVTAMSLKEEFQQQGRTQLSRMCGMLFSSGLAGMVYNTGKTPIKMKWNIEKETAYRFSIIERRKQDGDSQVFHDYGNIIFCDSDNCALDIFRNRDGTGIQAAAWNRGAAKYDFHYIEKSKSGIRILSFISKYTEREILDACFTDAEREKSRIAHRGEGIIETKNGELECYEFLSSNITKLAAILKTHKEQTVGIICFKEQEQFIRKFGNGKFKLRMLNIAAVENLILQRRSESYEAEA